MQGKQQLWFWRTSLWHSTTSSWWEGKYFQAYWQGCNFDMHGCIQDSDEGLSIGDRNIFREPWQIRLRLARMCPVTFLPFERPKGPQEDRLTYVYFVKGFLRFATLPNFGWTSILVAFVCLMLPALGLSAHTCIVKTTATAAVFSSQQQATLNWDNQAQEIFPSSLVTKGVWMHNSKPSLSTYRNLSRSYYNTFAVHLHDACFEVSESGCILFVWRMPLDIQELMNASKRLKNIRQDNDSNLSPRKQTRDLANTQNDPLPDSCSGGL